MRGKVVPHEWRMTNCKIDCFLPCCPKKKRNGGDVVATCDSLKFQQLDIITCLQNIFCPPINKVADHVIHKYQDRRRN